MTGSLGQCKWCPWDCPSPDVASCREPDEEMPDNPARPTTVRKWIEDIIPDISHYEEGHEGESS